MCGHVLPGMVYMHGSNISIDYMHVCAHAYTHVTAHFHAQLCIHVHTNVRPHVYAQVYEHDRSHFHMYNIIYIIYIAYTSYDYIFIGTPMPMSRRSWASL